MDSFGAARKRGRFDASNGNVGLPGSKRSKETESGQPGLGSKSKPCTKFFSTSGCPFGEGCHFLHYVPGGYNAVAQMTNVGNPALAPTPWRNPMGPTPIPDTRGAPVVKTRLCNNFNTPEGCKFGEKCRFAHGEKEIGKHLGSGHHEPPVAAPATTFGASATAKISVDASLAGIIIGKSGVNTKHICRLSGVKLSIRDHESDPNLRNIELEGTFDQIKQASAMVRELIINVSSSTAATAPAHPGGGPFAPGASGMASNYKTKLCEKFSKGSCTFGERCHFAHGASELR